ncbi:hypothetical protein NDU88_011729 [Pleurodeles waltl]|uniref:Uncharacterized protein n=1 Tax=Pleurodeles waltl TaxID=8319 RepID=A0AAV7R3Y1_PLEWA|nr:hypothetical protein NDU88_011729 [Pleurodeles waltl]
MCRLTGGAEEGTGGAAGAVLWERAALELRKTRLAVAHFPLRGRSSGSNRRSGRDSTSSLLPREQRVDDGAHEAVVPSVKGGSLAAQTAEETAGLVRGRGRRRLGEESLGSTKKSGNSREVNVRGKSGGCGVVICEFSKETPLVSYHRKKFLGAKLAKKGKTDSPVIVRPKITSSLRSYFKILPLVASDDCSRFTGPEEGTQPSVIKMMEEVGTEVRVEEMAVGDKSGKKDRCPVLAVDLESQEEQTGESPPGPMGNNNHAPGISQPLRVEVGEGTARLSPMEEMIMKLAEEIKKGFSVSKANQASIKEVCEILETKFDLLAKTTQLLEETVESLKEDVVQIKQDLQESRACEQDLQDKVERIENVARRHIVPHSLRIPYSWKKPKGRLRRTFRGYIVTRLGETLAGRNLGRS